jgi:uncharacterized protein (TIGR02246 family)
LVALSFASTTTTIAVLVADGFVSKKGERMVRLVMAAWLLAAASVPAAAQSPRAADDRSLSVRVQRFEDKEEIQNLLLEYGRHLDNRDFAAYSRLFAKDGEWVGGFGSVKGPSSIQAFMEKNMGTGPNRARNYHLLSNFVIAVNGDTATAWSRWAFVVPGERGAVISQAGRYDDTLVREDGHWKFKRRVASNDTAPPAP